MTSLAEIIAAARPVEGGFAAAIPAGWMQGRTAYGGLSAALALHAAQRCETDLPPLRSAQVAFIGPLAGEVTVTATRLRRGRNAAFVQADVASDAGLGLRATFVFMAPIPSRIEHDTAARSARTAPDAEAKTYRGPADFFTGNFDFYDLREEMGAAEWLRWGRLAEREGLDPMVELVAVADGLPPAAFRLVQGPAPISTLSWTLNLLVPQPATHDGWFLLSAATDIARGGYSSQRMTIWNADGQPVAEAIQGVAVFA